jgi:NAD(P)-dependent dehydrogenase (short-subunit alcohol dehydrogenase family)
VRRRLRFSPMGVAFVTGGSRGIGAASVRLLAAAGWDVGFTFRTEQAAADAIVSDVRTAGRRACAIRCDVAEEASVIDAFRRVTDELGPMTAFVNNAGVVDVAARLDEMSAERLERMFRINAVGAFVAAREAVKCMSTKHGGAGGSIVNVGSAAARIGSPNQYIDYAASKAAMDTMTLGLSKEVAAEGLRVNCVRPGITRTDIHASGGQPDRADEMGPLIPLGRAGEPEEIAELIVWLCSPASSYVTGAIIDASGGR